MSPLLYLVRHLEPFAGPRADLERLRSRLAGLAGAA